MYLVVIKAVCRYFSPSVSVFLSGHMAFCGHFNFGKPHDLFCSWNVSVTSGYVLYWWCILFSSVGVCSVTQTRPGPCSPLDCVGHKASMPMVFFRQECWSGLPFPPPGDRPDPGIKLSSPVSPPLQADSLFWAIMKPLSSLSGLVNIHDFSHTISLDSRMTVNRRTSTDLL